MKPRIIERDGQQFVMIPLKDFERLLRKDQLFPDNVIDQIKAGKNRIRVFRQYRGMTQKALAEAVHIARPYLTEIETGKKKGAVTTLKAIAKVLGLELQDIT
jgi:DNA-binding XRE family transcriptional regulator